MIEPNEPDGYLVTCPALPGLVTEGDTLDEVYAMAQDAVQGFLESLTAHGDRFGEIKSQAIEDFAG